MDARGRILDGYIFRQTIATLGAVLGVVMSLMLLEHLPHLIEISRLSGQRGYVVTQMIAGLLPEYLGVGLLAGLYLGIALAVRRLAMRGELDVIEACGIGPWRWMRTPVLLAITVGAMTLFNQGWLIPLGERRLEEIGQRIAIGEFGYELTAGEFIELGNGNVLQFLAVEPETRRLTGLFLKTGKRTFTAASGHLALSPGGGAVFDLYDGQVLDEGNQRVVRFASLRYQVDRTAVRHKEETKGIDPVRLKSLGTLVASPLAADRSVAWGRSLWAVLALLLPAIAFVLGKPPRRETGAFGIILGMALFTAFLKTLTYLTDGQSQNPAIAAIAIVTSWAAIAFALVRAEKVLGQGFVDRWSAQLVMQSRRLSKFAGTQPHPKS